MPNPTDFTAAQLARFWANVDHRAPGECWEWRGARQVGRWAYGRAGVAGKWWAAHRLAWTIHHGPIPAGALVRHACDNPPCVNPAHLSLGTHADNTADIIKRGRWGNTGHPGESNAQARLTESDVRQLRRRRIEGASFGQLAKEFGISKGHAHRIIHNRNWRA